MKNGKTTYLKFR